MAVPDAMLDIIYDVQDLLLRIFGLLEFIIGISYVAGKYLTESIIEGGAICWQLYKDAGSVAQLCLEFILDVGQKALQFVFVLYYAIGHIVDAFHITILDFVSFLQHAGSTIGLFIESSFNLVVSSISSLVIVPEQVCSALAIIGDFFMGFCAFVSSTTLNIGFILISTPVNLIYALQTFSKYLVQIPPKVLASIPPSAHIGLLVLLLGYFIYCRLSFRIFFTSTLNMGRRILVLFHRVGILLFSYWLKPSINTSDSNSQRSSSGQGKKEGSRDASGVCVLCFENPVTYLATPCNHICVCKDCCYELVRNDNRCPLCRKPVNSYTRVYIS